MNNVDLSKTNCASWQPNFGRFFIGEKFIFEFKKHIDVKHDIFKFVIRDGLLECLN